MSEILRHTVVCSKDGRPIVFVEVRRYGSTAPAQGISFCPIHGVGYVPAVPAMGSSARWRG